jgi:hypothetical protein
VQLAVTLILSLPPHFGGDVVLQRVEYVALWTANAQPSSGEEGGVVRTNDVNRFALE